MSSGAEPLQIELTRIVTGYPDLDAILDKMYEDVQDPYYTGNPAETLRQVIETWDEYTALREMPDYPDLLPEYTGFDISLSNLGSNIPETPDTKYHGCPSDEVLHELIVNGTGKHLWSLEDPSLSMILRQAESFLAKPLESGVKPATEVPQKPIRWVRRKLESARRKVDLKPKRLGPEGTWVNEPDDKKGNQSRTAVQWERTVTSLRREDTLTD
ncbi:hypothetical protein BJ322DRAFT_409463 [Thelephora terrestris]|uniref:Uncharacterized protein n=1 Tax=Thelephora terrestris TaxID=56493 RepID=A0A9P6HN03_9AGAM|nr:hypothetical protein BJ322DRAFT_409463 [Thelephora terrestris]